MVKIDIATDHLDMVLEELGEDGVLLEWGSGGSTRYFAERLTEDQTLVSIEHDKNWWEQVIPTVAEFTNVHLWLYEPKYPFHPETYGTPFREIPVGLDRYIYGPEVRGVIARADVFFVDGVARSSCLAAVAYCAESRAVAFVHDAPPRDWYSYCFPMFDQVDEIEPRPGHRHGMTRLIVP